MILIFNFSIFLDIVYFACVSSDYFRILFKILEGQFLCIFAQCVTYLLVYSHFLSISKEK